MWRCTNVLMKIRTQALDNNDNGAHMSTSTRPQLSPSPSPSNDIVWTHCMVRGSRTTQVSHFTLLGFGTVTISSQPRPLHPPSPSPSTTTPISAAITISSRLTLDTRHSCLVYALNLSKDDLLTWDLNWHVLRYLSITVVDADPSPLIGRFGLLDFVPIRWVLRPATLERVLANKVCTRASRTSPGGSGISSPSLLTLTMLDQRESSRNSQRTLYHCLSQHDDDDEGQLLLHPHHSDHLHSAQQVQAAAWPHRLMMPPLLFANGMVMSTLATTTTFSANLSDCSVLEWRAWLTPTSPLEICKLHE